MSFVVSARQGFMGGASPGKSVSLINTAVTAVAANINVNLPSPQYFNFGILRVKSNTPATGATLLVHGIWASDGNASNITQLYSGDSGPSAYPADHTYADLITDIHANQVIVNINASVAGTVDIEFAGI